MTILHPWEIVSTSILGDYYIFRMRQDVRTSPRSGRQHNFYVLEAPDWINIIPVTPAGEIVMVRQFRHGTAEFTLEVPGGMVDPGEELLATARRELLEETGYTAERMIPLGAVSPNPAFLNNRCHTFLALDATPAGPQDLGEGEDISIELVPEEAIAAYIADGRISHALVIAAFYFYRMQYQSNPTP